MASRRAVVAALKMFALTFAGDVSDERIDLYVAALEDVPDEALRAATTRLVATHRGEWVPVPAIVREAAGANAKPRVDVGALARRIDRLGEYSPATGWISPCVEEVRDRMGGAVADAYGAAGGPDQLFAQDATTRAIALRDFGRELESIVQERGASCLALATSTPKRITGEAA